MLSRTAKSVMKEGYPNETHSPFSDILEKPTPLLLSVSVASAQRRELKMSERPAKSPPCIRASFLEHSFVILAYGLEPGLIPDQVSSKYLLCW